MRQHTKRKLRMSFSATEFVPGTMLATADVCGHVQSVEGPGDGGHSACVVCYLPRALCVGDSNSSSRSRPLDRRIIYHTSQ